MTDEPFTGTMRPDAGTPYFPGRDRGRHVCDCRWVDGRVQLGPGCTARIEEDKRRLEIGSPPDPFLHTVGATARFAEDFANARQRFVRRILGNPLETEPLLWEGDQA